MKNILSLHEVMTNKKVRYRRHIAPAPLSCHKKFLVWARGLGRPRNFVLYSHLITMQNLVPVSHTAYARMKDIQKFGGRWVPVPLGLWRGNGDMTKFGGSGTNLSTELRQKSWPLASRLSRSHKGHRNRHGSIGYL